MKEYEDKTKKWKIRNVMHSKTPVAFRVIEELESDGMIEDYDTFEVISDVIDNIKIFYMDNQFYMLDGRKKDFREINRDILRNRYLILQRCITNNIQGYIQRYGIEAFNKLSTAEFVEEVLGRYYEKER